MTRHDSLLAQLRCYEPADELEGLHRAAMVNLLTSAGAFSRAQYAVHRIPAGKGEPDHDHYDLRYLARTRRPDLITIDRGESNDLAWFTLPEAAERMPGLESHRVIRKIERILLERSMLCLSNHH